MRGPKKSETIEIRLPHAALGLVHGGDAVAGEGVDDGLVGAGDVLDDDAHAANSSVPTSAWLAAL